MGVWAAVMQYQRPRAASIGVRTPKPWRILAAIRGVGSGQVTAQTESAPHVLEAHTPEGDDQINNPECDQYRKDAVNRILHLFWRIQNQCDACRCHRPEDDPQERAADASCGITKQQTHARAGQIN